MVIDAFEQSCIIEGEIRLYSVLHGISECVQLILHEVITMCHTVLSITTSVYLTLYCALIWYTIYDQYIKKQWITIFCETRYRYDITVKFLLVGHVDKNRHVKHYNYHHIVFVFVIVVCIHKSTYRSLRYYLI